eukprot:scaffold237532_cov26-Tisochrysis_lutea.AAC.1
MSSACATRIRFVPIVRAPLASTLKIGVLSSRASLVVGLLPREACCVPASEVLVSKSQKVKQKTETQGFVLGVENDHLRVDELRN